MKRAAWLWAAVFLLALGVALPATAQTKITWWHWNTPERQQHLDPLIARFEQETGITVERLMVPWAELKERIILAAAGGTAPDVVAVSSEWANELFFLQIFEDLNPYIERDATFDYEDVIPSAMEMWQSRDGQQFAFPFDLDISVVFYNRALFNEAGMPYPDDTMTWDSMYEMAKRLTVDTDGDGLPDQYGFANGHSYWATYVWANGGDLLTEDGTRSALGTPAAREALEFWKAISQPDVNMAWGEASRFGYPHPPAAFAGGRIALYPIGAWAPSAFFRDSATGQWLVDFDATHMPISRAGQRSNYGGGQGMGVLATSSNKEAAFEFVKFLASEEVQTVSGRDLGQFPIRRSIALSDAFIVPGEPPDNKAVYVEAAAYARTYPKVPNWAEVFDVMNTQVADFVADRRSLSEIIENINNIVPAILSRATQ